jgi:hypothetical protein
MNARRPWTLAIAQRPFEWAPLRVANLVDSILRGFPIGALLLVESAGAYYDLDGDQKLRIGREGNGATHVQILDGQQRCLAIRATFGGKGLLDPETGQRIHLWINVVAHNHRSEEFDEIQGQRYYLHWSERTVGLNGLGGTERRLEKLPSRSPATGWVRFSDLVSAVRDRKQQAIVAAAGVPSGDQPARKIVREISAAVDEALRTRRIPVHTLPSQDRVANDLHQVFVQHQHRRRRAEPGRRVLRRRQALLAGCRGALEPTRCASVAPGPARSHHGSCSLCGTVAAAEAVRSVPPEPS